MQVSDYWLLLIYVRISSKHLLLCHVASDNNVGFLLIEKSSSEVAWCNIVYSNRCIECCSELVLCVRVLLLCPYIDILITVLNRNRLEKGGIK